MLARSTIKLRGRIPTKLQLMVESAVLVATWSIYCSCQGCRRCFSCCGCFDAKASSLPLADIQTYALHLELYCSIRCSSGVPLPVLGLLAASQHPRMMLCCCANSCLLLSLRMQTAGMMSAVASPTLQLDGHCLPFCCCVLTVSTLELLVGDIGCRSCVFTMLCRTCQCS